MDGTLSALLDLNVESRRFQGPKMVYLVKAVEATTILELHMGLMNVLEMKYQSLNKIKMSYHRDLGESFIQFI